MRTCSGRLGLRAASAHSARWAAQDAAKQLAAEERDVALREVSTMAQELEALQVALGSPSPTRRRE